MESPSTLTVASTDAIRSHFPALERRHHGESVAYFDGPGGTQVPRAVGEAVTDYLYHHNANTHWAYPTSAETDAALADARQALADFLKATSGEVAFGTNMTTLTFHLGRALGRDWGEGDELVVTELDHHANVDPWRELAKDRGLTVRTVPLIPETGHLDWDYLEGALNAKTRLLAIGAASNALGTINDVRRAADLAHAAGALVFIDAVHYAPHALVDVQAFDGDFLACSAYKFYGPHVGVLYARQGLLASLDVPKLTPAPDAAPERIETGTLNHEGIVGAAAAVDFLAGLAEGGTRRERLAAAYEVLHARGAALLRQMWEGLAAIDGVTLFGSPPGTPRTPTVGFTVEGFTSEAVTRHLAGQGVFTSHGDFYAETVVKRLGVEGLVRAGCACYTTEAEVARLIDGVRALVESTV